MLYVHENNLNNKIKTNYNNIGEEIKKFYSEVYLEYRKKLESLDYSSENIEIFKEASNLMDRYFIEVESFSDKMNITSQSKFRSTFLEEINTYLFKDLTLMKDNTFGIYNKDIFSGMKINNKIHVDIIPKDVDFCIGRKVSLVLDGSKNMQVIIPIICVEVKTYLDATMFGEVQYSSRQIKNASPNAKTYVLMEYNDVSREKIVAARYDNNLNEMFVLRSGSRKDNITNNLISPQTLLEYYIEIKSAIENITIEDEITVPGKLLHNKN